MLLSPLPALLLLVLLYPSVTKPTWKAKGCRAAGTPSPASPLPLNALCIYFNFLSLLFLCVRCDLCTYHLISDTSPLYKCRIYNIYKYPIFYFCMIVF